MVLAMTPISAAKCCTGQTPHIAMQQRGFTLLELMVVLTLALIVAGLVVPKLDVIETRSFDAEVRKAAAILDYARRLAIVEGQPQTARFIALDATAGDFTDKREQLLSTRKNIDWFSDKLTLKFRQELNRKAEQRETTRVTFFPQGGSTGGVLDFEERDFRASIRIDAMTGRITTALRGETLEEKEREAAKH